MSGIFHQAGCGCECADCPGQVTFTVSGVNLCPCTMNTPTTSAKFLVAPSVGPNGVFVLPGWSLETPVTGSIARYNNNNCAGAPAAVHTITTMLLYFTIVDGVPHVQISYWLSPFAQIEVFLKPLTVRCPCSFPHIFNNVYNYDPSGPLFPIMGTGGTVTVS